ncbi:MAG: NADPH-dependent FMN reductase [Pseudonocardiaceae bacterium]|nr:NADPH-dependent FMN reductase [Pseudonocardiaceae bacterium]
MSRMGSDTDLRVAIIIGSTRNGRFGPTAAEWFADQARQHGELNIDVIDLSEEQLPDVLIDEGDPVPERVTALAPRLDAADAFVIVTPEYNHSYPAPLKTAIDWYMDEWQAKPVAFVCYGGMSGGLRSVEHLRQIFAELGATTVREVVSFQNYWEQFGVDGSWPKNPEGPNAAAKGMLDQLIWWARALRDHRAIHPLNPLSDQS